MILYIKIETNLIITWIIVSELMRLQLSFHKCVAAKLINFGFRTSRENIKLNCPVDFWYTALHIAVHTILCSEVTDKESPNQKKNYMGLSLRKLLGSPTVEKKTATRISDSHGTISLFADKNLFSLPSPTPLISSTWSGEPGVSKLKRLQIEKISWRVWI